MGEGNWKRAVFIACREGDGGTWWGKLGYGTGLIGSRVRKNDGISVCVWGGGVQKEGTLNRKTMYKKG